MLCAAKHRTERSEAKGWGGSEVMVGASERVDERREGVFCTISLSKHFSLDD